MILAMALLFLAPLRGQAHAQSLFHATPTEAAAMAAADNDHTAYILSPEKLAKAEALKRTHYILYFGGAAWGAIGLLLILELGLAARMRNVAVNLSGNRWAQAVLFLGLMLVLTAALDLPLAIFSQNLQRSYGLSVQSWGSWLVDHGKEFGLALALNVPGVMSLFWLMRKYPRRWWLPAALGVMAFTVLAVFWYPYVVDPLFNRFEPLSQSHPELVTQLERVVARQPGFSIPARPHVSDEGFGQGHHFERVCHRLRASKRVVVWDNSITKSNMDEVLDMFGHEMGHYVLGHVTEGMLISLPGTLVAFWVGFHIFQFLLRRFGPRWGIVSQQD